MSFNLRFHKIVATAQEYLAQVNTDRLNAAFSYARKHYEGQSRNSGDALIEHPLITCELLMDMHPDENSIIASLLHEIPKLTDGDVSDIKAHFGDEVALLVSRLYNLRKVYLGAGNTTHTDQQIENFRKMFLALAGDLRVIMIRLCDRLHNMRTLAHVPENKRRRIAYETMEVYAPIAARFGVYRIKTELENLSFMYLNPESYHDLEEQLSQYQNETQSHISHAISLVREILLEYDIDAEVTGRLKHIYSLYSKMKHKGFSSIADVHDLFAIRIILPDRENKQHVSHCYEVLGYIHARFVPVPGRFKDYIAMPKPNGYRSLHTTVMGMSPFKKDIPTEIQIRTRHMHMEAEYGIAAHWAYDASHEWTHDISLVCHLPGKNRLVGNNEFSVQGDSIYVLSPEREVVALPIGSTPIDFAYALGKEVGHHCHEVRVNNLNVALDHRLKNGDIVRIIQHPEAVPKQNWLSFVKTLSAKHAISSWFDSRTEDRPRLIKKDDHHEQKENIRHVVPRRAQAFDPSRLLVGGISGIQVRYPRCCCVQEDVEIIGYVTRGRGISIHAHNCPLLPYMDNSRFIQAHFKKDT